MNAPRSLTRFGLLWLSCLAATLLAPHAAGAAEITWTGAVDSSWSEPGNWDAVVPSPDDLVIIPPGGNQPEIGSDLVVCSGIILQENATLRVLDSGIPSSPNAIYIIGPGDLDWDGVEDITERNLSAAMHNFDADNDGIPNIAETDSDADGMSDGCEFAYQNILHPYERDEPDLDSDNDGYTNGEECAAGSDPTNRLSIPIKMPAVGRHGLAGICVLMLLLFLLALRKAGPRARGMAVLLLAAAFLSLGLFAGAPPLFAATFSVDFALGHRIETAAASAAADDTLEINGASTRPWNGQSTYLNRPRILRAEDGPVFLGGMRGAFRAGILGEGRLHVASVYTGPGQPLIVDKQISAGFLPRQVFLGERFILTPTAEPDWGFHHWAGAAFGNDVPLNFQFLADGQQANAVFGPPGPDLSPTFGDEPMEEMGAKAGDSGTLDVQIRNIGQSETLESSWTDGLYLSRDTRFDAADYELDTLAHSGVVEGGDFYNVTFNGTVPDVAPGTYYLIAVADINRNATDANRNNNTAAIALVVIDINLAQ